MIFAYSPSLADAVPSTSFKCSMTGTCTATSVGVAALFSALQSEMNRVRKLYGLPADVTVDGKIGVKTAAKMIKLAQRIAERVPSAQLDPTIEGYAIEVSGALPSSSQVARDASDLLSALKRNGYGAGYVPPPMQSDALIDPYLVSGGAVKKPNIPGTFVVGPTASPGGMIVPQLPGGSAFPGVTRTPVPVGVKVAGIALGVLGILGLGAAAWRASQ